LSCRNHGYPVKHTIEECELIKCYFKGDYKATGTGASSGSIGDEGKRDAYLDPKGCLMIIGGLAAHESKHRQKLTDREVNTATLGDAVPAFLKWSETTITFDSWKGKHDKTMVHKRKEIKKHELRRFLY
jgi:hypothetical protein